MGNSTVSTGGLHHLRLTVTSVARSQAFYTQVLDFRMALDLPPGVVLSNGAMLLGLDPSPDPERAIHGDRFDENRVGLHHVSFGADCRADLERAVQRFDELGVPHGEIRDLGPDLAIYLLMFRDPDNILLALTAPYTAD